MIGCGDVAEVKGGPGFYKARDSELVAVMRRNGSLAADYARRHNVARWHDDAPTAVQAISCSHALNCRSRQRPPVAGLRRSASIPLGCWPERPL